MPVRQAAVTLFGREFQALQAVQWKIGPKKVCRTAYCTVLNCCVTLVVSKCTCILFVILCHESIYLLFQSKNQVMSESFFAYNAPSDAVCA